MNPKSINIWAALITLLLLLSGGGTASAEPDTSGEVDETAVDDVTTATPYGDGGLRYSLSAGTMHQAGTDVDEGGEFRKAQHAIGIGVGRAVTDSLDLDVDIKYRINDYGFSGAASSLGPDPWDTVHEIGFGLGVRYRLSEKWGLMLGPRATLARESGAKWDDALVYGGFAAVSGYPREHLMLGLGLAVFSGLEDTDVFPLVILSWEITERLLLGNPRPSGPAAPAGLELSYVPGDSWGYALGAAYRSFRFRLDRHGIAPDGIGEERGIPLWVKVSRTMGKRATASLYAGAVVNGELTLEDHRGREIGSSDYDLAPLIALTVSASF